MTLFLSANFRICAKASVSDMGSSKVKGLSAMMDSGTVDLTSSSKVSNPSVCNMDVDSCSLGPTVVSVVVVVVAFDGDGASW